MAISDRGLNEGNTMMTFLYFATIITVYLTLVTQLNVGRSKMWQYPTGDLMKETLMMILLYFATIITFYLTSDIIKN